MDFSLLGSLRTFTSDIHPSQCQSGGEGYYLIEYRTCLDEKGGIKLVVKDRGGGDEAFEVERSRDFNVKVPKPSYFFKFGTLSHVTFYSPRKRDSYLVIPLWEEDEGMEEDESANTKNDDASMNMDAA